MRRIGQNRGPGQGRVIGNIGIVGNVDIADCGPVSRRPPRRSAFTIVELLGVVLTLATLFALILPAVKLSIRTAQKRQAAADATALAQAVLRYRQTYGFWPDADVQPPGDEDAPPTTLLVVDEVPAWADKDFPGWSTGVTRLDHAAVIRALLPGEDSDANPRRIRFLDIPDARIDGDGRFLDPWGVPYALVIHPLLDSNSGSPSVGGRPVGWSEVVAFSFGPPGRVPDDDSSYTRTAGNLIFSAGVPR